MFRKVLAILISGLIIACLTACGSQTSDNSAAQETAAAAESTAQQETSAPSEEATSPAAQTNAIGTVSDTLAADEDALISTYSSKFEQMTYTDSDTGSESSQNRNTCSDSDDCFYKTLVFFNYAGSARK